jgi:hypothetical protein
MVSNDTITPICLTMIMMSFTRRGNKMRLLIFQGNMKKTSTFFASFIIVDWLKEVLQEWFQDPKLSLLIHQLQQFP